MTTQREDGHLLLTKSNYSYLQINIQIDMRVQQIFGTGAVALLVGLAAALPVLDYIWSNTQRTSIFGTFEDCKADPENCPWPG